MPKQTFTLLRFQFNSPLHIATVRADYALSESRFHSDSMYSAIIQAWSVLGIQHPILENQSEIPSLGFTLSSLFPFTTSDDGEAVYFFPKPYGFLNDKGLDIEKEKPDAKKLKKIRYYDAAFFNKFLNNTPILKEDYQDTVQGKYLTKAKIDKDFMQSEVFPRVYVPRYGETEEEKRDGKTYTKAKDTEIFYIERMFFKPQSGFYCLAQFDDTEIENKVFIALQYLQDEGLGTDRHVGNGLFSLETSCSIELDLPDDADTFTNLSLYSPESKELLEKILPENSRFETIRRAGWITSESYLSLRKKSVSMFREGSIFQISQDLEGFITKKGLKIGGKTVDLKPDINKLPEESKGIHPIYRVGKSLFLPLKQSI